MYVSHFGFHRQPFQSADASRAFFVSESIRTILPRLFHALRSDLGIAVLTGMPGCGKTALLRHIQHQLANEGRVIICPGASLGTSAELVGVLLQASRRRAGNEDSERAMAAGSPLPETRVGVLDQVRRTAELWGPVLLLIDDAQLIPLSVLNELRACTEEEWNGRGLIRCLVSAPVSFEEQLARSEYAEFSRRIRCHAFLQPLKSGESIPFLKEQIELVGGRLSQIFTNSALEFLATAAAGVPRCLSLLADESLVVAMESGEQTTSEHSVRVALSRLQHLQYNWNASPDADLIEESAAETRPSAETVSSGDLKASSIPDSFTAESSRTIPSTRINTGTQIPTRTTLAPGVIEFGGPATNLPPVVQSQAEPKSELGTVEITSDAGRDAKPSDEIPVVHVSADLSHNAAPPVSANDREKDTAAFEFGVSGTTGGDFRTTRIVTPVDTAASFEVGRRFFAESSADSISLENIENCEFIELLSSDSRSEIDDSLCSAECVTDGIDSVSTFGFIDFGDLQLSERRPVFDRYTWIELGRDVSWGIASAVASTVRTQPMMAECAASVTGSHLYKCASTSRMPRAGFIHDIPISQISDRDLMDQIRRNSRSIEMSSSVSPEQKQDDDCRTPDIPGLEILHDGQLIYSESSESQSANEPDLQTPQSLTLNTDFTLASMVPDEPRGFVALPCPVEKVECNLRSEEITEDKDVFRIVETLTSLRAEIRQFGRTGKAFDGHSSGGETGHAEYLAPTTAEPASESDSLVSKARRRLDERTTPGDQGIVALQIIPDARTKRTAAAESALRAEVAPTSTPQFSRLFTRLWENRRREPGPAECEH